MQRHGARGTGHERTRRGFTLVEILVVLTFLLIVGASTMIFGMRAIAIQELDSARDTAMSELVLARERAMGGSNDSAWGVRFATSSLTFFKGPSYEAREAVFDRTTSFGSRVTFFGATSVVFLIPDGTVQATGTVWIVNGTASSTVSVNEVGGIEAR